MPEADSSKVGPSSGTGTRCSGWSESLSTEAFQSVDSTAPSSKTPLESNVKVVPPCSSLPASTRTPGAPSVVPELSTVPLIKVVACCRQMFTLVLSSRMLPSWVPLPTNPRMLTK